jgi:hypothetical protein
MTSPIAQMPGTVVRKSWSVSIWPRWLARAGLVEAEAVGVGAAADRDEHGVGLDRLGGAAGGGLDRERRLVAIDATPVTLVESLNSSPAS